MAAPHTDLAPPWLLRLREALLAPATLPETDEHFVWEEVPYICHRRLDYDETGRLHYKEEWLEPHTYRSQKLWTLEIEAGAFAGWLPESVFRQQVAVLVEWLNASRPKAVVRERPATWAPHRFARHGRERR
jgi:hypothetical protein